MTVRLTPDLHKRLSRAAERDHRSKHGQMLVLIERGLTQDERKAERAAQVSARFAYSTHVRCACKEGQQCPKLWRTDGSWNSRHGSAGWAARVPTSTGTKLVRRFGYGSVAAAKAAAETWASCWTSPGPTPPRERRSAT